MTVSTNPGMKNATYPSVIQSTHHPDLPQHFTKVYIWTYGMNPSHAYGSPSLVAILYKQNPKKRTIANQMT